MGEELRPCPFCGGEAHHNNWPIQKWYVECMNPDCWIEGKSFDTPEAAAEWWNTRHEPENKLLRVWIMMETGVDEQHINDVLSDEASLSDTVKHRYD